MNNVRLPLLAVFFVVNISFSQTFEISGKVINTSKEVVPFANILLLNSADSTFVQGTSADENGMFLLEEVAPELYLLQASYVGRGSKPLALDIKNNVTLGALVIPVETERLDEVIVTAKRPKLQRMADRLVFQVENTVVSQGSSWDILKNTPGLIVNSADLLIRGRPATVYLNGRRMQLSQDEIRDFLTNLAGVIIKSVEIYANPPANFDAESGAVINIITNKSVAPGYKGSVDAAYTQAIFPKYSLGTSHYLTSEKVNLFANYTYNTKKNNKTRDENINFIDNSSLIFSRWETTDNEISDIDSHSVNVSLDYDFDDNNTLNITSNTLFVPNQNRENDLQAEIRNGQRELDSTFTTHTLWTEEKQNLAFDVTYGHSFKKPGAKLSMNAHYTDFEDTSFQRIDSRYFDASGAFLRNFGFGTDAEQNIQIYTGQVDYQTPIGNSSFEAGAKISVVDSESSIDYLDFDGTDETVDASLSDDFLYNEEVYAAYFNWVKNWEKWSLKLGLRGELTNATGTSLSLNEVNTQDFFEPFPTFYLLYAPNDTHSFSFDYGRRVQRPKYNDLNPFRVFTNENNFEEGNPNLVPNFFNNFNLNYTLNGEYFIDIYYRDNGNYINTLVFQDNQDLVLRTLKQNVLDSHSYGIDFTVSKSISNAWFLYTYASLFHEDETFLAVESGNQEFTNEVDGFFIYLANYLTLSKDGTFTGELTFSHMSNFLFGSYVQEATTNLTVGLRKSLWNDRAIFSISAEDLLGEANARLSSNYLNQDNAYFLVPETQFVRFGFTYNFGNFRLEDTQKEIDKDERDRLEQEN